MIPEEYLRALLSEPLDGLPAWEALQEALGDLEHALKGVQNILDISPLTPLVMKELGLKGRLIVLPDGSFDIEEGPSKKSFVNPTGKTLKTSTPVFPVRGAHSHLLEVVTPTASETEEEEEKTTTPENLYEEEWVVHEDPEAEFDSPENQKEPFKDDVDGDLTDILDNLFDSSKGSRKEDADTPPKISGIAALVAKAEKDIDVDAIVAAGERKI